MATRGQPHSLRPLDVVISIVVLFSLAVAQPLLDLLGRNAEFFLARAAPVLDIVLVGLALTVLLPLLAAGVVLLVRRVNPAAGRLLHLLILTLLGAVFVLHAVDTLAPDSIHLAFQLAPAVGLGMLVAWTYYRFEALRSGVRVISVAPAVVLGLFLFGSSTSQLVLAAPAVSQLGDVPIENPVPVVLVIFDEFPVASLMDENGNLEENVYPNFARLAARSTWFRNAVTIQQQTEQSVPTILTGRNTTEGKVPMAADYPFSLFTLLAEGYDFNVHEFVTALCPDYACSDRSRRAGSVGQRWRTLADDLTIVAGHLFLPDALTEALPPIDSSWTNFDQGAVIAQRITLRFREITDNQDRRRAIADFVDSLGTSAQPEFSFLHALVPHVPWDYLPSGQQFTPGGRAPGSKSPGWGDDEWLVDQGYQRHLLMVQYTDRVLGEIIDRLEEQGIYDQALVVVLADHGVAVRPNIRHRRVITPDTVGEIAAIPLFVKQPFQREGRIDDYRALTIDVLPTIADVLGVNVPWPTDGVSLFAQQRPTRTETTTIGAEGPVTFGVDGSEARAIAARKIERFGHDGPFGLAPSGYAPLLGRRVDEFEVTPADGITAVLSDRGAYRQIDVDGPALPTWVRGRLETEGVGVKQLIVAVAVNGRIAAVTRSFVDDEDVLRFGAMIPPDSLVDGTNDIDLFLAPDAGSLQRPAG